MPAAERYPQLFLYFGEKNRKGEKRETRGLRHGDRFLD